MIVNSFKCRVDNFYAANDYVHYFASGCYNFRVGQVDFFLLCKVVYPSQDLKHLANLYT